MMQRPTPVAGSSSAWASRCWRRPAPAATARGRHSEPAPKLSDEGSRARARPRAPASLDVIVRFRQAARRRRAIAACEAFGGTVRRQLPLAAGCRAAPRPRRREAGRQPRRRVRDHRRSRVGGRHGRGPRDGRSLPQPTEPESALKGAGVTIAVVDSGVAPHPEHPGARGLRRLRGRPTIPPSRRAGSVDPNGHGTHVAGIMVGNGSHSADGKLAGIAPEASLVSVRVLDGAGRGNDLGRAGRPAVGARPQGPVRHPRPQPVARASGLRAGGDRSAGAGGGRRSGTRASSSSARPGTRAATATAPSPAPATRAR